MTAANSSVCCESAEYLDQDDARLGIEVSERPCEVTSLASFVALAEGAFVVSERNMPSFNEAGSVSV